MRRQRTPTEDQMRQAVLYARVSSKDQEREGFSIPAQLKFLREYAQSHELNVLHELVDVETAKTTGRKQFGEMVRFLRDQKDEPRRFGGEPVTRRQSAAISELLMSGPHKKRRKLSLACPTHSG